MRKKTILLVLAVALDTTTTHFATQDQKESSKKCTADTTRCMTKANGDVIFGERICP